MRVAASVVIMKSNVPFIFAVVVLASVASLAGTEAGAGCIGCGGPSNVSAPIAGVRKLLDIIGRDDRRLLTAEEEAKATGIGQVVCSNPNINGGKVRQAVGNLLLESDVVATSGHVLYDSKSRKWYDLVADCRFQLYSPSGSLLFESRFLPPLHPLAFMANGRNDFNDSHDFLVTQLETQPPAAFRPFSIAKLTAEGVGVKGDAMPTFVVGYHIDPATDPNRKYMSSGCAGWFQKDKAIDPSDVMMRHDCDTVGGASGSGLFFNRDGEWLYVGIHNAGAPDRASNVGIRLDGDFYAALKQAVASAAARRNIRTARS